RRIDSSLHLPAAAHEGDAGYDLRAREAVVLAPGGGRAAIPTGVAVATPRAARLSMRAGVAVATPPGGAGLVLPRSGLALRHGVSCLNAPGLIDAGYRGELEVLLVTTDAAEPYTVRRGDRIAQLVVVRVEQVAWHEVDALDETTRDTYG